MRKGVDSDSQIHKNKAVMNSPQNTAACRGRSICVFIKGSLAGVGEESKIHWLQMETFSLLDYEN